MPAIWAAYAAMMNSRNQGTSETTTPYMMMWPDYLLMAFIVLVILTMVFLFVRSVVQDAKEQKEFTRRLKKIKATSRRRM